MKIRDQHEEKSNRETTDSSSNIWTLDDSGSASSNLKLLTAFNWSQQMNIGAIAMYQMWILSLSENAYWICAQLQIMWSYMQVDWNSIVFLNSYNSQCCRAQFKERNSKAMEIHIFLPNTSTGTPGYLIDSSGWLTDWNGDVS